ncbi:MULTISPECIES: glycosyl hydrolase family 28-related protein [Escherichia]|nr:MULTISPECIES: glycosyl hydrolase family 28-related protein [Escherichia]MDU4648238.1 glycosyl hydrolase family 28-related protein [Escherichia coli]MDU4820191.1 glycosyl hydrolase family 28-related protein [Escherichia coli]MDZ5517761.1 glycosyl hydrolase family 28-related protein [Escherichia marmotae]MED0432772.1 glycosyl hydrolase family 28-related protein [Escherichia coli]
MTVSTEVDHNEYTGNGVTTSFPYTFRIFRKSDLVVQVSDLNGNVTELVLDTGYTVTGAGTYSGGSVVLPSPLAAGWRITIDRVLDVVQETDLRNQGKFFPEVHEDAFDYLTMLIQQCFGWFRRALMKPSLLAKYYDAKQNRISNLADPSLEQDAVNNRSMRNYVDAAIAGVVGGFGWFIQYGSGAVYRTFQDKMRDNFSVKDFGAKGDGVYSDSDAINAAALAAFNNGGGEIFYPPGVYLIDSPVILYTGVHHKGSGKRATFLYVKKGSNTDVFKTHGFGVVENLSDAPYGFSIKDMTIDGNYLDLQRDTNSWRTCDTVNNDYGTAIKIFGSMYHIDVEINNVAEHALYSEGYGSFHDNQEHASEVRITGRISGREGVVFRGPGDINLDYIVFGLCGLPPYSARLTATSQQSLLYPGEPCHGIVLDNQSPYTGHVDINYIHVYAVYYGYGFKTLGVNRFNARHVCVDNSLGGYWFTNGAHGVVAIAEARACGRMPDNYTGDSISPLRDMLLDNGTIWTLNINIKAQRYSPSIDDDGYQIAISGNNNVVTINQIGQLQSDNTPIKASFLSVTGDNNNVTFTSKRIKGNLCYLSGGGNNIRGTCDNLFSGAAFIRDATNSTTICFANSVDITAKGLSSDCTGFNSIGTCASENIRLMISGAVGYTKFTGDRMAAINRTCVWMVMATIGNSINGKSTEDYLEWAMPTPTDGDFHEVDIEHNFLYAPTLNQISWAFRQPGTEVVGATIEYIRLIGVPTDTTFKIRYKWSGAAASGSAPIVTFHIK